MEFIRLRSPEDVRFAVAMALYRESFPAHEQRTALSQREALRCDDYHFTLLYDGDRFVGLLLYWEAMEFRYVEHFCIDPSLRNQSYGRQALDRLTKDGKTVILEIDPPINAIAVRRKGFYERCGFRENPYAHVHPPYHPGNNGHALLVLSYPAPLSGEAYERFNSYLQNTVMSV